MATQVVRLFRKLDGLFAVYKPPGVHWKLVRDTVETNLLKGMSAVVLFLSSRHDIYSSRADLRLQWCLSE